MSLIALLNEVKTRGDNSQGNIKYQYIYRKFQK